MTVRRRRTQPGRPRLLCLWHGRECLWAGGSTDPEYAVYELCREMHHRGQERDGTDEPFPDFVAWKTSGGSRATERCRQATARDRKDGIGIYAPPSVVAAVDAEVAKLIETLFEIERKEAS